MIPKNINKKHILRAIEQVEKSGIPKGRRSKKFVLKYKGKEYPPKYVLSIANVYANGKELAPNDFSGGDESNSFLKNLNFTIKTYDPVEIKIRQDPFPSIARIIIARQWEGHIHSAKNLLEQVYKNWPKDTKVPCILTCGGFIQFDWPKSVTFDDIGDNKSPKPDIVTCLIKEAEKHLSVLLDDGLNKRLGKIADFISIGIDSFKEKVSTTQNFIGKPHIELACMVDLRNLKFYWTGKSYPTTTQERGLVRITDFKSHFFKLAGIGKVMVLACHDLNMFNNRNMKNTGAWRKRMKHEFRALAKKERPVWGVASPAYHGNNRNLAQRLEQFKDPTSFSETICRCWALSRMRTKEIRMG